MSGRYWCHTCQKETVPVLSHDDELQCPTCAQCFVEEIEDADDPHSFRAVSPRGASEHKDNIHPPRPQAPPEQLLGGPTDASPFHSLVHGLFGAFGLSLPNGANAVTGSNGNMHWVVQTDGAGSYSAQMNYGSPVYPALAAAAAANRPPAASVVPDVAPPVPAPAPSAPQSSVVSGASAPQASGVQQQPVGPPPVSLMDLVFQAAFGPAAPMARNDQAPPADRSRHEQMHLGGLGPNDLRNFVFNVNRMLGPVFQGQSQRQPPVFGDYAFGSMTELLNHLFAVDRRRYGSPPASAQAVQALPEIKVDESFLKEWHDEDRLAECSVCKEDFKAGDVLRALPCKHHFHPDCVLPWLNLHNTCPTCRFELPTDDAFYEQSRGQNSRSEANVASNNRSQQPPRSGGAGYPSAPGGPNFGSSG